MCQKVRGREEEAEEEVPFPFATLFFRILPRVWEAGASGGCLGGANPDRGGGDEGRPPQG